MDRTKTASFVSILILASTLLAPKAGAQVSVGADILSRYIWRGVDYGNSPSFQPSLALTIGTFKLGTWGAYSFAGTGTPFAEHDLWASWDIPTSVGTFSALYTDYYYPSAGLKYFNFEGEGTGAHTMEVGIAYTGPSNVPLTVKACLNVHNDPDKSVYLELAYPVALESVGLNFFLGTSAGKSVWYGTQQTAVINVGITASKSVTVTESFSLPVSASFIVNPDLEQSYLIVGMSF